LGCIQAEKSDLKLAEVDWDKVGDLLNGETENDEQNSSSIKQCHACVFPYTPLKIALLNEYTPVPGRIIKRMLQIWPEESLADIHTTFKIACANNNIQLDAIQALLEYQSGLARTKKSHSSLFVIIRIVFLPLGKIGL
jgi:hypothetical protein